MQKSELQRLKNERGKPKKKSREKTQSPVETEWEVSAQFSDGSGLQCAEVSSNECAICLGEYEGDVGEEGEPLLSWVECTNPECKKWMHEQRYKRRMMTHVCNVCNSVFCWCGMHALCIACTSLYMTLVLFLQYVPIFSLSVWRQCFWLWFTLLYLLVQVW